MTRKQYERWKDFAKRMARTCFWGRRRPTSKWIVEVVDDWFSSYDDREQLFTVHDWDNSGPFKDRRREYYKSYCGCGGARFKLGYPDPKCRECRGSGIHYAFQTGSLMCDDVSQFLDGYEPHQRCRACRDRSPRRNLECDCDDIESMAREQWADQWGGPVRCCIRAGLDMAVAPSAGVVGFTAGDLRRMYPRGVPKWVMPPDERLHYWLSDEINGTFAELPDIAGIVL